MKKLQKAILVAWSVLLLGSCNSTPSSNEPPCLELSVDSIDIGTVVVTDEPKAFDVELRNTGGQDLVITNIETTCNCTTVDYLKEPIKSGRSVTLHLTFSGKDFFPSKMVREVQIFSNDESSPKSFYFRVTVAPPKLLDSCDVYKTSF